MSTDLEPHEACRIAGREPKKAMTMIPELAAARTPSGHTPLHCAASYGRNDVVAALLAAGADVNAVDQYGKTPLRYANAFRHDECARMLEAAGARKQAPQKRL